MQYSMRALNPRYTWLVTGTPFDDSSFHTQQRFLGHAGDAFFDSTYSRTSNVPKLKQVMIRHSKSQRSTCSQLEPMPGQHVPPASQQLLLLLPLRAAERLIPRARATGSRCTASLASRRPSG